MIKLNVTGHNDMCGGYSYSGNVYYSGTTVKDVLKEIKEYAKDRKAEYIGDGFGNKNCNSIGICWGITINDVPYVGSWAGWENKYKHEYDDYIVTEVRVNGGWYCFYDFNIKCKKPH